MKKLFLLIISLLLSVNLLVACSSNSTITTQQVKEDFLEYVSSEMENKIDAEYLNINDYAKTVLLENVIFSNVDVQISSIGKLKTLQQETRDIDDGDLTSFTNFDLNQLEENQSIFIVSSDIKNNNWSGDMRAFLAYSENQLDIFEFLQLTSVVPTDMLPVGSNSDVKSLFNLNNLSYMNKNNDLSYIQATKDTIQTATLVGEVKAEELDENTPDLSKDYYEVNITLKNGVKLNGIIYTSYLPTTNFNDTQKDTLDKWSSFEQLWPFKMVN